MFRVVLILLSAFLMAAHANAQADPPIPNLSRWESDMLSYGATHCASFATHTPEQNNGETYYDAIRVYRQIRAYTGDSSWDACITDALEAYRDWYVRGNNGVVPGYWNFTTGMRLDYQATGSAESYEGVVDLATNAAWCTSATPLSFTETAAVSREVANCIRAYIDAELIGEARNARLTQSGTNNDLVDHAIDHIDQWFITKDFRADNPFGENPACAGKYYYQPFMVALTVDSLIRFHTLTGDSRIVSAVTTALDGVWEAWDDTAATFWYDNCKTNPGDAWPARSYDTWDLNLLHVANFAWLYEQTDDTTYRDRADALFTGGVLNSWLGGSKQFNQNYIYAFDYVSIRSGTTSLPHLDSLQVREGPTYAEFLLRMPSLTYETDCSIVVKEGLTTIETISSTEGLASRILSTSVALDPATAYTATQSCTDLASDTNTYNFTTRAAAAGGDRTVPIQIAAAPTYSGIARASVQYDDNAALSTPATVQNTDCAGACTINLTIPAGRYWYRVIRQTSGDVTVAVGGVQPLSIP